MRKKLTEDEEEKKRIEKDLAKARATRASVTMEVRKLRDRI